MDTIPNGHHPEWTPSRMDTIPNGHHSKWTPFRMDTIPYGHHPIWIPSHMDTIPYGHHPIWTPSHMDTIPYGHHPIWTPFSFSQLHFRSNTCEFSTDFSIPEISPKEVCCIYKIKLASLAHERERFFAKVSVKRLLRLKCFCWKIACYRVLQSLHLCISQQLLQRKIFCIKVVARR